MASHLYISVDKEWEEIISRWTEEKLECCYCGSYFYEINNLGAWKCSQHAAQKPLDTRSRWPCCNRIVREVAGMAAKGCVRADHTTMSIPFDEQHDISIPLPLKDYIGIYHQSVVEDDDVNKNKIKIRRFDWKTADTLGRNNIFQSSI